MKIKVNVAQLNQNVVDEHGYVYKIKEIHEKYAAIGNGQYIMHEDYMTLPDSPEMIADIKVLFDTVQNFYKKYGQNQGEDMLNRIVSRLSYIEENDDDPRHVFTFEDFTDQEGDLNYEYEYGGTN
ncbi:hypothetical protein ACTHAL_000492 [Priestia flexa]|uniref:hypothetical protein n=1 Tax=Priestia flexa TaxID=86664 RepID=UPI003F827227